jgi:hypothetical protein
MGRANKGKTLSQSHKEAISISKKMKGVRKTPEHTQRISKGLKGHTVSQSTRLKISKARKGTGPPINLNLNRCAGKGPARAGALRF